MDVTCCLTEKVLGMKYATSAFGSDRTIIQDAFPGDVIGLINATGLKIGDTLYTSQRVEYPAVTRIAPEVYATAQPSESSRVKEVRPGSAQLAEESKVPVFHATKMGASRLARGEVGTVE